MVCKKLMTVPKLFAAVLVLLLTFVWVAMPVPSVEAEASDVTLILTADENHLNSDGSLNGGKPLILQAKSTSGAAIELSGTLSVIPEIGDSNWGEIDLPQEGFGDIVWGGESGVTLPENGDPVVIATIQPGPSAYWRPHDSSYYDLTLTVYAGKGSSDHSNLGKASIKVDHQDLPDYDFLELQPYDVEYGDDDMNLVISVKNTSDKALNLSGKAIVVSQDHFQKEVGLDEYTLLTNEIPAGETVAVVKVDAGPPYSWRNFYFPQVEDYTVWLNVAGPEEGIFKSNGTFAIVGELIDTTMQESDVDITDNEDGTVTLGLSIHYAQQISRVTRQNGGYTHNYYVTSTDEPVEGLHRSNFVVTKLLIDYGQVEIGSVLRVKETSPGIYELIWDHSDGTHKIILEANHPDEDVFTGMFGDHTVTISTLNRKVESTLDTATDEYTGTLSYPNLNITFTSDQEIDATINVRQKSSSERPLPTNIDPAGLYYDINLAEGSLDGVSIELEIPFSRSDIPEGMDENYLRLYRYNETTEAWDLLPKQEVDSEAMILRVWLDGFSEFGIFEVTDEELAVAEPVTEEPEPEEPEQEEPEQEEPEQEDIPVTGRQAPVFWLLSLTFAGMLWVSRKKLQSIQNR